MLVFSVNRTNGLRRRRRRRVFGDLECEIFKMLWLDLAEVRFSVPDRSRDREQRRFGREPRVGRTRLKTGVVMDTHTLSGIRMTHISRFGSFFIVS